MIIWADSFDHYGDSPSGGRTAMLSGAWAQFSAGNGTLPEVSTERSRTGNHSLKLNQAFGANSALTARRVLGAERSVVGVAMGLFPPQLPSINALAGFEFRNSANQNVVRISLQSDGSLAAYSGTGFTLVGNSDPVIGAASWSHVEAKVTVDDIVGEIQVRVNGENVLHVTDLDLGTEGLTQMKWGTFTDFTAYLYYVDDLVTWDDAGSYNNDFVGQQRVHTIFPNSDLSPQDWGVVGAAAGYEAISDSVPDGDNSYVVAEDTDDVSQYGLDSLPPETESIAGVYIPVMARIGDAGTGIIKVSLESNGEVSDGPDTPLTTAYTYWGSVHEVDPNTDDRWTKESLEAAALRITKVL